MISRSTPYTSFPSQGKYLYKEQPVPVSHLAHLLSDDLELYQGNNNQLQSIKRNRINFFNEDTKLSLNEAATKGIGTELSSEKPSADDEIKTKQQKKRQRKRVMVFAVIVIIMLAIVTIKFSKS